MKYLQAALIPLCSVLLIACRDGRSTNEKALQDDPRFKLYVEAMVDKRALMKQVFLYSRAQAKKQNLKADRMKKPAKLWLEIKNERGESLQSLNLKSQKIGWALYNDYVTTGRIPRENFEIIVKQQLKAVR